MATFNTSRMAGKVNQVIDLDQDFSSLRLHRVFRLPPNQKAMEQFRKARAAGGDASRLLADMAPGLCAVRAKIVRAENRGSARTILELPLCFSV